MRSYPGRPRLAFERATCGQRAERGVSRGRSSRRCGGEGPNGRESETTGDLERTWPQMTRQLELPLEIEGEARQSQRSGEAPTAASGTERSGASGLHGAGACAPEHAGRVEASSEEQGQSRHRWDDRGRVAGLAAGTLATCPRGTARRRRTGPSRSNGNSSRKRAAANVRSAFRRCSTV